MNTISGIRRRVIDLLLVSSDLKEHIEHIHLDDTRKHVPTKSIYQKN